MKSCKKIQIHPPVQVPSLIAPECAKRILISRKWWVTVHNCARRKRTSIMCASNFPSLLWNITGKVLRDSNNVETKIKLSGVLRETDASTKRENPGLLESSSSHPLSMHTRMKSIRSFERIEFWVQFLDDRRAENSSSSMSGSKTLMNVKEKRRTSFEKNIPKIHWEEFTYEDWLHCFYRRRFETNFDSVKMKMEN